MSKLKKETQGFTLVELSIVIIIIGFLIAGVSAGQSLIKQAKLNSVVTELTGFDNALNTFKIKYSGLPGDLTNASAYWPDCDPTPGNCNGDGNGIIDWMWWIDPLTMENYRSWQQLSKAGMLAGSYTGIGGEAHVGIDVPASKYADSAGYLMTNDLEKATVINLAKEMPGMENNASVMPSKEVYNIDLKIDDGIADTGIVRGWGGRNSGGSPWDTECTSGSTYLHLDGDVIHCNLGYHHFN